MPPKSKKKSASKQKHVAGNVQQHKKSRESSGVQSISKTDEDLTNTVDNSSRNEPFAKSKQVETNSPIRRVSSKRKADEEFKSEKMTKKSKDLSIINANMEFSPRRSSRCVVPNRKFKDMEVEFTPGRKQNNAITLEENDTSQKETPKSQKETKAQTKQKKITRAETSTKDNPVKDLNKESSLDSAKSEDVKQHETEENNTVSTKSETGIEILPHHNDTTQIIPTIKIIKFDKDNNMEITDFNPKESNNILSEQSETPEFSIIQEEDLEKITSELLELAQCAEQEHRELQQIMFKDSAKDNKNTDVSTDLTETNVKIIEVQMNSDRNKQTKCDDDLDACSVIDGVNLSSKMEDVFQSNCHSKVNNVFSENEKVGVCGEKQIIMVENIMQKQISPNLEQKTENDNDTCEIDEKEKHDLIEEVENTTDESSKSDIIPISFEDNEIQVAVRNALIQFTDKSANDNENQENKIESEKKENVTSSGTQTASEGNVIKLPALHVKPRIGPIVKSITVDVEQPGQVDESGKKVKPGTSSKQEFIIVHVPYGQEVKRSSVRVLKPEDSIPFSIDQDGVYHCGVCDYQNDKKVNLYKHRKKHIDDRPHFCPYCKYKTATSSNLKRHISIHQDIRNFRCHLCNTTFRQKIHLERHIRYRHEEKKVKCPLCDYVCANENPDLKVHMKRRHLPQDSEDGLVAAFKCTECNLVTVNKKDFKQHMKFHRSGPELKLFCEHCSFVTDCESRLKRHSYIHSKEKPFKCGICEYRATQKEHVVRHMRSQHGIEIERRSRRTEDEESLDSSIDSRDESPETKENGEKKSDKFDYSSQEKIFACNHCSMKFAKLLNLYKHLHAQHKEILPEQTDNEFLCVVCDFKTTTKKNLLVHMRKHNQIDQIPPSHVYSCVLCNYINPKRRNLFQHMKKKHGIEIVMKDDGSTSCFVTDGSVISSKCDETVQNILTIGDIVTTETEEQELQIVTDDLEKDGIQVQNVISFDDIAYAVSHPQPHNRNLIVVESNAALVQEHEAAEAIEGLQALAEQPGIITSSEIIAEVTPQLIAVQEMDEERDKIKNETEVITMATDEVRDEVAEKAETEDGIQLSADEVMHLSAGDFVEINGEMYKVEISEDTGLTTEIVASSS